MPLPPFEPPAIRQFVAEGERTNAAPSYSIATAGRYMPTNVFRERSIGSARVSRMLAAAAQELEGYSELPAGWDGYDGEPISPIAIRFAKTIIAAFGANHSVGQRLTDVIPGPASDGSLDLELRTARRRLIITMYPGVGPDEVEVRSFRTDGVTSEEKNDLHEDALVADIHWLFA